MQETQQKVAQSGEGLGSFAGATGVLTQDGISFVVEPVLDGPVTPPDAPQAGSIRLGRAVAWAGRAVAVFLLPNPRANSQSR